MNRLLRAFAGEWKTVETMEKSEFFPHGGARHGTARFRLGTGGTTLIEEGNSDGSAGKLNFLIVIWWDKKDQTYRFMTCFNGDNKPCQMRGAAQWEGDKFVNDYEETVKGKAMKFQDIFSKFTDSSFTLVEAVSARAGASRPLITTKYSRAR